LALITAATGWLAEGLAAGTLVLFDGAADALAVELAALVESTVGAVVEFAAAAGASVVEEGNALSGLLIWVT
jgi:hypothetical protein